MVVCHRYCSLWKAVVGEALGVFMINLTLGGIASQLPPSKSGDVFLYSVFYASITVAMTMNMHHVSGGHLNPAITTAMMVSRRINIGRAVLYIIGQCSGAVMGSGLIFAITYNKAVGLTKVNERLDIAQAFGMETMGTFVFAFSYFAAQDRHRKSQLSEGRALLLATSLTAAIVLTRPYTGGSLNPARSLGPAVIENEWDKHWVFWLGPLVGGAVGGFLYDLIFAGNSSLQRALSLISDTDYDPDLGHREKIPVVLQTYQSSSSQTRSSHSWKSNLRAERGARKVKWYRDQRSRSPSDIGANDSFNMKDNMIAAV